MPRESKPWYWTQRDTWCCTVGGTRYLLAKGKANKGEAMAEFHRLMVSLGRSKDSRPERITVNQLAEIYLESVCRAVEREELERVTYDGYVRFLSSAAERLGATRVVDLTPHAVLAWCEAPALNWGPTNRANAITAVKAMTRWARRVGLLGGDPLIDLRKPTRRKRTAVLTDDQVRAILRATEGKPFHDLVLALWESGCRPKEVATLPADRINLNEGTWTVRNKTRAKTGQPYRTVYLTPTLIDLSRRLMTEHPEGPIFRNARGRPWTRNAMACAFRRLRPKLGLGPEATAYAIRHRYAREALRIGLESSDVAALMGHSDTRMVDTTYGGWDEQGDRLREAARKVRPGGSGSASGAGGPPAPSPAQGDQGHPSGPSGTPKGSPP